MTDLLLTDLSYRSYNSEIVPHSHDHLQIVIPDFGEMELEIGGKGALLSGARAAVVAPNTRHAQWTSASNRFLVIDCDGELTHQVAERFAVRPFVELSPALRILLDFVRVRQCGRSSSDAVTRLILQCLLDPGPGHASLLVLRSALDASPADRWTIASMARIAGLSSSRLHALFKQQLGETPQRYLHRTRLRAALEMLQQTDEPVVSVALAAGFSDQSAFTRAMRRALGTTPAAYRRSARASAKTQ